MDNFIHNTAKTPLFLNPISPYYLLQAIANHQKTVFFKFKDQPKFLNSKPHTNRLLFLNLKRYIQLSHLNLKILLWITNFKFKSTQNSYL